MSQLKNISLLFALLLIFSHSMAQSEQFKKASGSQTRGTKQGSPKDTIKFVMKTYKLLDEMTRAEEVKVDTSINNYQNYHPELQNSITVQSLGNFGSAYQSNNFFQRADFNNSFLFFRNYSEYGIWANQNIYYNVTKPYTLLEYGQWFANKPNGETWLKVFHTQNIGQKLNFGIIYNSISSQGKYLNQEAKVRNIGFFSSYNNDRYDYWFALSKNQFDNDENGGLPQPDDIKNPDLKPENLPVWLNGANTIMDNLSVVFSHQYKLGSWKEVKEKDESFEIFIPRVTLMHTFELTNAKRKYTETEPNPYYTYSDDRGQVFYYGKDHIPYINGETGTENEPATIDRSAMNRLSNRFYIRFVEAPDRKYTFGKQVFIGNDIIKVKFPRDIVTSGDSILGLTDSEKYSNTFVGGSIYRSKGQFWNWNASGKYFIQGRNSGDFEVKADIDKPIVIFKDTTVLKLRGEMVNSTPNYFYERYFSNHYKWDQNLDKTYRLTVGGSYESPKLKVKAGANYSVINKYVFVNEDVKPEQAGSAFSVMQIYLQKDFKAGGWNFLNKVMFQQPTSQDYLHIPQLVVMNSSFYEGLLAKVLSFQIGFDVRYETEYYADKYSPALGLFYLQNDEKIGSFPWIDAYINLRLKRTRFYIKYSNLGTLFMDGGYFTSPGYPAQIAAPSFGLSWSFYD